jgi:hypothetical protein
MKSAITKPCGHCGKPTNQTIGGGTVWIHDECAKELVGQIAKQREDMGISEIQHGQALIYNAIALLVFVFIYILLFVLLVYILPLRLLYLIP